MAGPLVVGVMAQTEQKLTALSKDYMNMSPEEGVAAIKELRRLVTNAVQNERLSERAAMIRADQIDGLFARIKARSPAGKLEAYDQVDLWWRSPADKAWLEALRRERAEEDKEDMRERRLMMDATCRRYPDK